MTPAQFISTIHPSATECEQSSCIPAAFTVAQAALESGWGTSALFSIAHNVFGVKADKSWHGDTISMKTAEYVKGKRVIVPAKWRKYASYSESIADHSKFLTTNRRYKHALTITDPVEFAREIQRAGYATDPKYADKLISIMKGHDLV